MRKIDNITVQDLLDFVEKHNLPTTTKLGICIADSERGSLAGGIIAEMKDSIGEDEFGDEIHCVEGSVYCKNMNGFTDEAEENVIIITDGCHSGSEDDE